MVQLELPHVNVLTKADLCKDKQGLEGFRFPDPVEMRHELDKQVRRVAVAGGRWGDNSDGSWQRVHGPRLLHPTSAMQG